MSFRACRFEKDGNVRIGAVLDENHIADLGPIGPKSLTALCEDGARALQGEQLSNLPRIPRSSVRLLAPVEQQEVWAAGVTYLRSKKARMEESDFSASAYDRVYEATRPEIFFKSLPQKVVSTGEAVGIRKDATWNLPEPELALVLNSRKELVGFTIGNDMSSRDIEGENVLYLPQAKIYDRSCALGPWIVMGVSETEARSWTISVEILRAEVRVFFGETSVGQIKRSFTELADFLFRSQTFPHGAILLTGTGVVPPDNFTLLAADVVRIRISGIGLLENTVTEV